VLRIACPVCLIALVAGGCGAGGQPRGNATAKLPPALAANWANEAEAIASAAAAGQSCQAKRLAGRLRDEVIKAGGKVPSKLSAPLLGGVNSLSDRIVCTPQIVTRPAPTPKPPEKHPHHDHHKHHGDDGKQG